MFRIAPARLAQADPELWAAIAAENRRQEEHIELIASENYASPAVMAAQGSQLTNKYAEGYPGKRYYGGCEYVDVAEQLAIDRAEAAVRRRSRQRAAAFRRAGQPGGVLRGAAARRHHHGHEPAAGGHLTHGMPLNMSGKWFKVVRYGLDPRPSRSTTTRWSAWRTSTSRS